jgi:hypothetical protein
VTKSSCSTILRTDLYVGKVGEMVRNYQLTACKTEDKINVNRETVTFTLTNDLNMKKVCAKMIQRNLSSGQKMKRKEICSHLSIRLLEEPNLLKKKKRP